MDWLKSVSLILFLGCSSVSWAQEDLIEEQPESVDPESIIEDLNDAVEETQTDEERNQPDVGEQQPVADEGLEYEQQEEVESLQEPSAEGSGPELNYEPKPEVDLAKLRQDPAEEKSSKIFGAYKIHVGAAKPDFAKQDQYQLVYGDTRFYPTIAVEYFFFDWFATLGLIMKMGYYKDSGHAVIAEGDGYVSDRAGKTDLTLIPLQTGLSAQLTPFPAKWVSLGGWYAFEATYFQEFRESQDDSSSAGSTNLAADDEATEENGQVLMTSGWRYGNNFGLSVSINLNGLDERSVSSLGMIGINNVYLTPYIEYTVGLFNSSELEFDRTAYGIAFTFETI